MTMHVHQGPLGCLADKGIPLTAYLMVKRVDHQLVSRAVYPALAPGLGRSALKDDIILSGWVTRGSWLPAWHELPLSRSSVMIPIFRRLTTDQTIRVNLKAHPSADRACDDFIEKSVFVSARRNGRCQLPG